MDRSRVWCAANIDIVAAGLRRFADNQQGDVRIRGNDGLLDAWLARLSLTQLCGSSVLENRSRKDMLGMPLGHQN